jgi:ubiquitin carboxyl-terminal hydrolase 8
MLPKWQKYQGKAYTGLSNLGNTCFLNSCVQALNHTYELHEIFDSKKIMSNVKSKLPESQLIIEWNDLRDVIWKNNGIITPHKFVSNIHRIAKIKNRDIFTGWSQNDMPEFLLFIIESFHNSISRSVSIKITGKVENNTDNIAVKCYEMLKNIYDKEYSEIMDLFYGIYVSEISSIDTNIVHSIHPEHFFVLDLPLPIGMPNITLHDCFDTYTNVETLIGDNAWYNDKTKKYEDIKKCISFWSLPKVLIITLKRFSPDGQQKNDQLVDFPIDNLDLSKYIKGYNRSQYNYELYAVCNHFGNTYMGHYTAFIKNASNEWIHYNDQQVSKIDTDDTNKNKKNIVTPMAYCLFYRKKNTSV